MSGFELDTRPVAAVVLSSQLAYGSVGNNAIARMIELAGHRTVAVPTVLLSNLPHYPSVAGGPISDQWLGAILEDLLSRDALRDASYVVVGYLGAASQGRIIADWFRAARARYPKLRLILDPAFGDTDVGLYARAKLLADYANLSASQWTKTVLQDGFVHFFLPILGEIWAKKTPGGQDRGQESVSKVNKNFRDTQHPLTNNRSESTRTSKARAQTVAKVGGSAVALESRTSVACDATDRGTKGAALGNTANSSSYVTLRIALHINCGATGKNSELANLNCANGHAK
ncbi:hypothetical protein ACT3R5_13225 [Glutamicibacter sp. AOP5-A2-7]